MVRKYWDFNSGDTWLLRLFTPAPGPPWTDWITYSTVIINTVNLNEKCPMTCQPRLPSHEKCMQFQSFSNFACNLDWFYDFIAVEYNTFNENSKHEKSKSTICSKMVMDSNINFQRNFEPQLPCRCKLHIIAKHYLLNFHVWNDFLTSRRWYQTAEKMWYSGPYFLGSPLFASKYKEEIDLI